MKMSHWRGRASNGLFGEQDVHSDSEDHGSRGQKDLGLKPDPDLGKLISITGLHFHGGLF